VKGDKVECSINNKVVVSYSGSPRGQRGVAGQVCAGTGVTSWIVA
jgi:hypothetical protein